MRAQSTAAFQNRNSVLVRLDTAPDVRVPSNAMIRAAVLCALTVGASPVIAAQTPASAKPSDTTSDSAPAQRRDVAATKTFNIDAPRLSRALIQLTEQAGLQLIYPAGGKVEDLPAKPVVGQYTTEAALHSLLKGSGLQYEFLDPRTIAIVNPQAKPVTTASPVAMEKTSWRLAQADTPQSMQQTDSSSESASSASSSFDVSAARGHVLTEIVVTAQKREERLQDVPVPVTAVSGNVLAASNQLKLQEYFDRIPNLSITTGTFHALQLSIRGLTTGGGNPTVGIVIDDVPYGSTRGSSFGLEAPDLDPSTLQRVEVLRGPQGTLYGASSMGGLLKFVTVAPTTDSFYGRVQGGTSGVKSSGQIGYNARGSVNIPVSEDFALSASAFTRRDPGYIDNPILGLEDINDAVFSGGRAAAHWELTPRLTVNLSAFLQRSEVDGTSEVHERIGLNDLEQDSVRGSGWYDKTNQAYSAMITADLGVGTLTSLTGYNISSFEDIVDFSVASGRPALVLNDYETEKLSQELRFSIPLGDKVDWLLGAFYTDEKTALARQQIFQTDRVSGSLGTQTFDLNAPQRFEELAAFTNITVKFTEQFDIQFGARQSRNEQRYQTVNGLTAVASPRIETDDQSFTYLVTPRYRLTPDVMVYGRVASGYRPGGPNTNVALFGLPAQAYEPDKTKNYEVGAKGEFLDGDLRVDASVYRIDWEDIQILVRQSGFTYYTNGSEAKSEGLELAWELQLFDGLSISAWGAWGKAELTEQLPSTATIFGAEGSRLPYGSKVSGNVSVDQGFQLSNAIDGHVGLSVAYIGERLGALRGVAGGVPLPRQVLPSYTKIDLRAGLAMASWDVDFFLNNVTDRRGTLQGGLGQTDPTSFYYIQPRTYGFSVSKSF